ncbi:MAG: UDP-N-acetylglucosamine 2-epimerase (non-hydrolyzing) [Saprospiraceae bacterium]|nr:UDP-N-acetylglucosamine 2-epimerase (non-hydrolyzing) [Saprospiraceae bacterium]
MKIHLIVGARPNFVKAAALWQAFREYPQVNFQVIHTGQHYDAALDRIFFQQLEIPEPTHCLGVGSDTPARQLTQMLLGLEPVFEKENPALVIVVGDTNSALAGALAASKMDIPLAHVEAGLRSGDRTMPEEINRILIDNVTDYLFVTEQAALNNLELPKHSKFPKLGMFDATQKVYFTGNCMLDTLVRFREKAAATSTFQKLGLQVKNYALVTLHRPSNVDTPEGLEAVVKIVETVCQEVPVIFPLHPRTRFSLEKFGLKGRLKSLKNLQLLEPQGYLEFLNLMENAALVVTDSGGVQDETTFLGVPCLTLRTTTERPVTIELGTNELMPTPDAELVRNKICQALEGQWKPGTVPPLWDGQTGRRIAKILVNLFPQSD